MATYPSTTTYPSTSLFPGLGSTSPATYPSLTTYPSTSLFPSAGSSSLSTVPSSTRYMDVGVTRVYYLPSIAAFDLAPTRAEMNAGTSLTGELADWTGWLIDCELLDVQDISQAFKAEIPGSLSAPSSSLTLYASKNGADVRGFLSKGINGFIMILDGGDIVANSAEVFPITVASISGLRDIAAAEASKVYVNFGITGQPAQGVPVPA